MKAAARSSAMVVVPSALCWCNRLRSFSKWTIHCSAWLDRLVSMRRGHNESNCLEEKANHPENCPHDVSFFPMAPNLARIRGWSSQVPCLKLIVNGNIEHKSDCVAHCECDNGAEKNLEFSAFTQSTQ